MKIEAEKGVYDPAEDSWMLAGWVEKESAGKLVLDVGTGSGVQAVAAALGRAKQVWGVDINQAAVACARKNAEKNGVAGACSFSQSDLFGRVKGKFDLIIFNPPYLPVEKKEDLETRKSFRSGNRFAGFQDAAWDGGKDGRLVLDKFLGRVKRFLKPGGEILLVQSSLCAPEKTLAKLEKTGFQARVVEEKSFFFEKLSVVQAWRPIE